MNLADKIITLRKKRGWSQETLAEKMEVSRQAVSKWESAQTVPDLDNLLALAELFGVTTDYLLKDEIEDEGPVKASDRVPAERVSVSLAEEYLAWRKRAAWRIALGAFLCIVAAIPLLLLYAATELPSCPVPENVAASVGLVALFVLVAPAVALFVSCGLKNAPFRFLDDRAFETEHGVDDMVRAAQRAYRPTYIKIELAAACLCVLSPVPLFAGLAAEGDFLSVVMLTATMTLAGIGAALFTLSGVRWASLQKLLKEGSFARRGQRATRIRAAVSAAFWLTVTAAYLLWSFLSFDWEITWVLWPAAGILFAASMCLWNLFSDREKK